MNFKKLNRLTFTKENTDNSYVSWDIGKEPVSPRYDYKNLTVNEYCRIIRLKTRLDEIIYRTVLDYLNNQDLCNSDEGFFPRSDKLTGNYYIGREYYRLCEGEIQVSIQTRFTEMYCGGAMTSPGEQDYLGIEVHLAIKNDCEIEIVGVDSSSI